MYLALPSLFYPGDLDIFIIVSVWLLMAIFLLISSIGESAFNQTDKRFSKLLFAFSLILYISAIYYVVGIADINVLNVLYDFDFQESERIRKAVYGNPGFIIMWIEYAPMIICLYFLHSSKKLLLLSIIICGYFYIIFGSRGHLINLMIFILIGSYYTGKLQLHYSRIPFVIIAGGLFFLTLTFLKFGQGLENMDYVLTIASYRIGMGVDQLQSVISYVDSKGIEFGYSYIRDILTVLPAFEIGTNKNLSIAITGYSDYGNFTPTIIGEGYLNFGPLSIFLFVLYAWCIYCLNRSLSLKKGYFELKVMLALIGVKVIVNGLSGMITALVFCGFIMIIYGLEIVLLRGNRNV